MIHRDLAACIRASIEGAGLDDQGESTPGSFNASRFFLHWLVLSSQPYLFVFNQNLRSTNIQLAEILALLRLHAHREPTEGNQRQSLRFENSTQFKQSISELASHVRTKEGLQSADFTDRLWTLVCDTVVVDFYFGSCSVFPPPHIAVDIGDVCGEAGYVHSCGKLILVRNAAKLDEFTLIDRITRFASREHQGRVFLRPYCHEDFSLEDRDTPFLKNGLDDLKLHMAKASIGQRPLIEALSEIPNNEQVRSVAQIDVAKPGSYKRALFEAKEALGNDVLRTWFWIMDSAVGRSTRLPDDKKYYILYEQMFKNQNAYHWFDENKPAWVSHTTLPHTLAAAMINVTRPWWPTKGRTTMCDPFGGSGTVYLEAQKHAGLQVQCFDMSAAAVASAIDNRLFFQLSVEDLKVLQRDLEAFESELQAHRGRPGQAPSSEPLTSKAAEPLALAKRLVQSAHGDVLQATPEQWKQARSACTDWAQAIRFYVALRGLVRHAGSISRDSETESEAAAHEARSLLIALRGLLSIRCTSIVRDHVAGFSGAKSTLKVVRGSYSLGVAVDSPPTPHGGLFGFDEIQLSDIEQLRGSTYDVIICDPPYGFNTEHDLWNQADFFDTMIERIVNALSKEGGQVVMACPEMSFTGKPIPPFVRPYHVIREFIRQAEKLGRRCQVPAVAYPGRKSLYQLPYYWYSDRALRRAVLHFWIV